MVHVYGLVESGKSVNEIRYIGITNDPQRRLHSHRSAVEDTDKGRWIASLRKKKQTVDMVLLDSAPTREIAHAKENAWILFARSRGWNITNGTEPGERRAILEEQFASTEGAVIAVKNLLIENAAIKANALYEQEIERKNHLAQSAAVDNHFRTWYQIVAAVLLGIPAMGVAVWMASIYPYQTAVEKFGIVEAATMLVGSFVAYPVIAFVLWFFLKDVPLYRPGVGSAKWKATLDGWQLISLESLKRIVFHVVMAIILLSVVVFF